MTAPASAQPAPVPFYNWSGFYVGVNGGAGGGPVSPIYDLNGLPQPGFAGSQYVDQQHHRMGGAFAGGQAGYNYQFGNNVVVGIESDLQWSNIAAVRGDTIRNDYNFFGGFPNGGLNVSEMRVQQNWFGTTRLRAGYAFADRFLAYVTGGLAYSNFSIGNSGSGRELYPFPGIYSSISGAASSTRIGWAAGAGFELGITSRVSLKSEYLYTSYSGVAAPYFDYEGSDPHNTNGTFSSRDLGIHLVRAGLNYRLQDGEPNPGAARAAKPAWTPNWSGFYAGVNGGYGAGGIKPSTSELLSNTIFNFGFPPDLDLSAVNTNSTLRSGGFAAGAQAGYNLELPNRFLVGIETDLQWSGIRGSRASSQAGVYLYNPMLPFSSGSSLSVNQNWFGTTRLRLGYRPLDRLLVYATGGLAYSGFSAGLSSSYYDPLYGDAGTVSGWGNSTRLGWAAGAGFEYALGRNLSFKTEYLYTQYGGFNVAYRGYDTDGYDYYETTHGTLSTGTIGIHLVRGGLNWKFGD